MSSSILRKTLKAQCRAACIKAKELIVNMDESDLRNLSAELGRELNVKAAIVNEVRIRLDAVRNEIERRRTLTKPGICVSDHAIMRYLERHKGIDMKSIREEIIEMAMRSGKVDSGDKYSRPKDPDSGLAIGFNGITNVVTTVFSPTQTFIMDVQEALD